MPISAVAVALVWAIYWVPGIPLDVFAPMKDLLLLWMLGAVLWGARRWPAAHRRPGRFTAWWLVAISLATVPGVVGAPDAGQSLAAWLRYPAALLVYLAARRIFRCRPEAMVRTFKLLAVPVVLAAGAVHLSWLGVAPIEPPARFVRAYRSGAHLMGLSYRTSGLAWSIGFVAPILVYHSARAGRRLERRAWLVAAVACLLVCFSLMNRGGLFAAIVGSLVVGIAALRGRRSGWIAAAVLVPVVCYGSVRFAASPVFQHRSRAWEAIVEGRGSRAAWDLLTSGRYHTYREAVRLIVRHPVTGIGFAKAEEDFAVSSGQSHNLYLSVSLAAGLLPGLLVALLFACIGLRWLGAFRRMLAGRAEPFLAVPLGMVMAHVLSTLIENGPMFSSLYLGITFWFALAAMEVLSAGPPPAPGRGRARRGTPPAGRPRP